MVVLIEPATLSGEKVWEALSRTFARRGAEGLPATVTPPPEEWGTPLRALVEGCGLAVSLAQVFEVLRRFHARVDNQFTPVSAPLNQAETLGCCTWRVKLEQASGAERGHRRAARPCG